MHGHTVGMRRSGMPRLQVPDLAAKAEMYVTQDAVIDVMTERL